MDLQSISKVSKTYDISTRTLRYYEQIGLISSVREEDYAYRMYDEEALTRLRQILVLRKLRIPLKEISEILNTRNGQETIRIFEENLSKIDEEVEALDTIKNALKIFINEIDNVLPKPVATDIFDDDDIIDLIRNLSMQTIRQKETITMKELNQANKTIERVKGMRIIYVPPMHVASYHLKGKNQEKKVIQRINEFIISKDLKSKKPDFRRLSFNNPAGDESGASLGFEAWVSIPEDMKVESPLVKKEFQGGVYAAKMIPFGEFQEWGNLWQWVMTNSDYDMDYTSRVKPESANADPAMEEQLNAINQIDNSSIEGVQLDLLIPIVQKKNKLICQSCGMNIDNNDVKGSNEDGSLSDEYCSFCFRDGKFTNERTIDEKVDIGLQYSEEYQNAKTEEEKNIIIIQTRKYLSGLKRWNEN